MSRLLPNSVWIILAACILIPACTTNSQFLNSGVVGRSVRTSFTLSEEESLNRGHGFTLEKIDDEGRVHIFDLVYDYSSEPHLLQKTDWSYVLTEGTSVTRWGSLGPFSLWVISVDLQARTVTLGLLYSETSNGM